MNQEILKTPIFQLPEKEPFSFQYFKKTIEQQSFQFLSLCKLYWSKSFISLILDSFRDKKEGWFCPTNYQNQNYPVGKMRFFLQRID